MSMRPIYTTTVGPAKEGNLSRRANIFLHHFLPHIIHILGSNFDGDICEIGAGMGHKFQHLSSAFPRAILTGVEPSVQMLGKAHARNIHLQEGTLSATGLLDASQDVVCLFQMWHHINPAQYQKCIDELTRILKPNGTILLLDTFDTESGDDIIRERVFEVSNRFYAVLSQFPVESLLARFGHAVASIFCPKQYHPHDFGYFSPTLSATRTLFGENGFEHNPKESHGYGISDLVVFRQTTNSSQTQ